MDPDKLYRTNSERGELGMGVGVGAPHSEHPEVMGIWSLVLFFLLGISPNLKRFLYKAAEQHLEIRL